MAEKKTLFGSQEEEWVDALEAIYKRQKAHGDQLEEIKTMLMAMKTTILTGPEAGAAGAAGDEGDDVPPLLKWAASQPWGVQLLHGLTDSDMISGLVKSGIEWLKSKAVEKASEVAGGGGGGGAAP